MNLFAQLQAIDEDHIYRPRYATMKQLPARAAAPAPKHSQAILDQIFEEEYREWLNEMQQSYVEEFDND